APPLLRAGKRAGPRASRLRRLRRSPGQRRAGLPPSQHADSGGVAYRAGAALLQAYSSRGSAYGYLTALGVVAVAAVVVVIIVVVVVVVVVVVFVVAVVVVVVVVSVVLLLVLLLLCVCSC
ncbi:unnamed protein product, partial [Polarella glacialis]